MKSMYFFLIAFACTFHALSQSTLGVKMGFTVPAMVGTTENTNGYSSELNFNAGIAGVRRLSNYWYLQTEVNYAPQSAVKSGLQPLTDLQYSKLSLDNNNTAYAYYKHEMSFTYLEIPVMVKFITGGKYKFSFCTGPYLGILLNARSKCEGSSNIYKDKDGHTLYPTSAGSEVLLTNVNTVTTNYKRFVAGLQAGVELIVPFCGGNAFLESRTSAGLTNLNKRSVSSQKFYSGSFTLSAGYSMAIKKHTCSSAKKAAL